MMGFQDQAARFPPGGHCWQRDQTHPAHLTTANTTHSPPSLCQTEETQTLNKNQKQAVQHREDRKTIVQPHVPASFSLTFTPRWCRNERGRKWAEEAPIHVRMGK